ncbi:MAG: RNA methyltransferase [Planctomycetes bacterium]|nr:RNA methyltransferase [Planctomycetota bacterium]
MTVTHVLDLDAPDLKPFLTLRRPKFPFDQGLFVAEGPLVIERLLQTALKVRAVLCTPDQFERFRPALEIRSEIVVHVAERKAIEKVLGVEYHHGVMALGECPPEPDLKAVLAAAKPPRRLVALDGLVEADNVGVIVRSCAALGATALLSGETSCSPWLRRAVRNSMGGVFALPILHAPHLAEMLRRLRGEFGARIVGADPGGATALNAYRFPEHCCLVFGTEFTGLSAEVRAACDEFVAIPLAGGQDSLNVSAAAAVFLYQARFKA